MIRVLIVLIALGATAIYGVSCLLDDLTSQVR